MYNGSIQSGTMKSGTMKSGWLGTGVADLARTGGQATATARRRPGQFVVFADGAAAESGVQHLA